MQKKTKIVIVGNGFGGIYTLKNLHKIFHGKKNVEITLIGEKNYFLFTPLLHEVATGSINPVNIIEPIRKVLDCCMSNFYLGKATEIDADNHTVKIGENTIEYDYLVLAPGAETNYFNTPGAKENTLTLKGLDDAIRIKNKIIAQIEKASHLENIDDRKKALSFIIVGGGPTGVELAGELQEMLKDSFSHYFKKEIIENTSVTIIQKNEDLLTQFGKSLRIKSLKFLRRKGITVLLNTIVKNVGKDYVMIDDDKKIDAETIIWVAGIKPKELNFRQELTKTLDKKLVVNEFLQLDNHPHIYALGDVAAFKNPDGQIIPALAQVAEKEAKNVAENIYRDIKNKKLKNFYYRHSGSMVSLGQWMAIGEISFLSISGRLTWWLWRTVYLSKLISFRKKVRVAIDWTLNIFSPRDISEF